MKSNQIITEIFTEEMFTHEQQQKYTHHAIQSHPDLASAIPFSRYCPFSHYHPTISSFSIKTEFRQLFYNTLVLNVHFSLITYLHLSTFCLLGKVFS